MGSVGQQLIDYDKWGPEINLQQIRDKDGTIIGFVNDEMRSVQEEDIRPVTKKQALDDILSYWDRSDGWYVDDDTKIYFAYSDGTFRDVDDAPKKALNRKGLIGAYISTPDYEIAWGGELNSKTGQVDPWTVHNIDSNGNEVQGVANSFSGYKTTGFYKVRTKQVGRKYKIIRRSTVKRT